MNFLILTKHIFDFFNWIVLPDDHVLKMGAVGNGVAQEKVDFIEELEVILG